MNPETCECYNYAIKHDGETRKMIEYSAYEKVKEVLLKIVNHPRSNWVIYGEIEKDLEKLGILN